MLRLRVKEIAEARGITKAKLARLADLGTMTINDLWVESRDPRLSTLEKVARALGVRVTDLFEDIVVENQEVENRGTLASWPGLPISPTMQGFLCFVRVQVFRPVCVARPG
jgi:transcriptional regulator with XRE-family HTH domain